jgi:Co/Zn/Cd efflux system component
MNLTEPLELRYDEDRSLPAGSAAEAERSARGAGEASLGQARPLDDDDEVPVGTATCLGTHNLRALWGMFILNTAFAISQMVGSKLANSLSMFSDSGSMLVDSLAYMINICMERTKTKYGPAASKLWEVYVSFISVSLLVTVTSIAIADAASRLSSSRLPNTGGATVDGRIVLGFSLGNLFIDVIMCGNYCYQMRHRRKQNLKDQVLSEAKEQLNMVAAYVHLFADTLRTITGLIAGILEQAPGADALHIDAVATFIVCTVILCAAAFVLFEGYLQYREYSASVASDVRNMRGLGEEEHRRFRTMSSASIQTVEMSPVTTGAIGALKV